MRYLQRLVVDSLFVDLMYIRYLDAGVLEWCRRILIAERATCANVMNEAEAFYLRVVG